MVEVSPYDLREVFFDVAYGLYQSILEGAAMKAPYVGVAVLLDLSNQLAHLTLGCLFDTGGIVEMPARDPLVISHRMSFFSDLSWLGAVMDDIAEALGNDFKEERLNSLYTEVYVVATCLNSSIEYYMNKPSVKKASV